MGGILAGIVGGWVLGPLMPINTLTGEMQTFLNWVYRLIFLCINGALVGHSSLAYLQKMHASALKIDQVFIKTLATDPNNQKIVRAILLLARSLGLETVAEGIEDYACLVLLREWGCDYGQGYAIHRPAPEAEFLRFLESQTGKQPIGSRSST